MKILVEGGPKELRKQVKTWLAPVPGVHSFFPEMPCGEPSYELLKRVLDLFRPDLIIVLVDSNSYEDYLEDVWEYRGQAKVWIFYEGKEPKIQASLLQRIQGLKKDLLLAMIRQEKTSYQRRPDPIEFSDFKIKARKERRQAFLKLKKELEDIFAPVQDRIEKFLVPEVKVYMN